MTQAEARVAGFDESFPRDGRRTSVREDVSFMVGDDRIEAWLYHPFTAYPITSSTTAPLVILAHGIGGTRDARLDAYGKRFAEAGIAALAFDYRGLGNSTGPTGLVSIRRQQQDIEAAVKYVRTLPGVDPTKIALWGTSLGGGHVAQIAARDKAIGAVIAQTPFTHGASTVWALGPISALGVGVFAFADLAAKALGRQPVLVPIAATPRMPGMLSQPGAAEGMLNLFPAGTKLSGNFSRLYRKFGSKHFDLPDGIELSDLPEPSASTRIVGSLHLPRGATVAGGVSARFGLRVGLWFPGRALRKLRCPTLVCVSDNDAVCPPGPTLRYARRAGVEITRYPEDHFSIYVGEGFGAVISDQIDFLNRSFGVAS